MRVHDVAAAQCTLGRLIADHEAVAVDGNRWRIEHQLHPGALPGLQRMILQQADPAGDIGRTQMDVHGNPMPERPRLPRQQAQSCVEASGRGVQGRGDQPRAPRDLFAIEPGGGDVDGNALTGRPPLGRSVLGMQAAHPHLDPVRCQDQALARLHRTAMRRPGRDEANARQRECPVHRQAEPPGGCAQWRRVRGPLQLAPQFGDPIPGQGRTRHDRGCCQHRAAHDLPHLRLDRREPAGIHPVGFGEHDDTARYAEQIEHGQMLQGLRHRPIIGGDHEQREVDPRRAGQHRVDQAVMAGHVDEADRRPTRGCGERVAEIDRDPAGFLFRQTVGIHPRQGKHQRGLTVVDVPRRRNDHPCPQPSNIVSRTPLFCATVADGRSVAHY